MGVQAHKVLAFDASKRSRKVAGLMRTARIGSQPARTLGNLFAHLRQLDRGELFASDPERQCEAARLRIDRTEGHGSTELYRLEPAVYIIAIDLMFNESRDELVVGEGLVEIHVCLRGALSITMPGESRPVQVKGPCLLIQYQPIGVDTSERLEAGTRLTGISLYCRPEHIQRLMRQNGIADGGLIANIQQHAPDSVWYRMLPLPSGLNYVATSLLQSPYRNGVRLLHAESKALEMLCEVLSLSLAEPELRGPSLTANETCQLDRARNLLCSNFSPAPSMGEVARSVGMSLSKLKRGFQKRFGQSLFECGYEARMRRAFELLKSREMSICQVAYAVGYQHPTSFSAAFRRHFGMSPRMARGS